MEVRETIGTTARTMLSMEVTTDGDQHQGMVNMTTETWERGGGRRVCEDEGFETAWLRPAL